MLFLYKNQLWQQRFIAEGVESDIPENLDYREVFDDIFAKYTNKISLERVKTVNLGSMYELSYHIQLKEEAMEKEFIYDEIRCRNGNLNIVLNRAQTGKEEYKDKMIKIRRLKNTMMSRRSNGKLELVQFFNTGGYQRVIKQL